MRAPLNHLEILAPSLEWREALRSDLGDIVSLFARSEAVDDPPFRSTEDDLVDYFSSGYSNCAIGGWDSEGQLRVFGAVRVRLGQRVRVRAYGSGTVDPQWRNRGIGAQLILWQTRNARDLIRRLDTQASGSLVIHVDNTHRGISELLESKNFRVHGLYEEMRRDLSLEIPRMELGPGMSIEPWSPEIDDRLRREANRAFGSNTFSPHNPETWHTNSPNFAPEWSFVALDRSTDRTRIAGMLLSGRYEQDWEAMGWSEGYTEFLGVLSQWRGQYLGSVLLARAMEAYRESGMEYAGVDVDLDNDTGARKMFLVLGYESVRASTLYRLDLGLKN